VNHETAPIFKIVTNPDELEQVYRLNYATFVDEIPQHSPNPEGRLVDPLLHRSTCYACTEDGELIGMVVVNGTRPFSLDKKLNDLDSFLPEGCRPCEVRLLAVDPEHRQGRVFVGLIRCVLEYCDREGYDLAVFSAAASQARMYRHAGCQAFGPQLGTADAPFQGMCVHRKMISPVTRRLLGLTDADGRQV
jgi:GNAT superfamily N-acetyltransferase